MFSYINIFKILLHSFKILKTNSQIEVLFPLYSMLLLTEKIKKTKNLPAAQELHSFYTAPKHNTSPMQHNYKLLII